MPQSRCRFLKSHNQDDVFWKFVIKMSCLKRRVRVINWTWRVEPECLDIKKRHCRKKPKRFNDLSCFFQTVVLTICHASLKCRFYDMSCFFKMSFLFQAANITRIAIFVKCLFWNVRKPCFCLFMMSCKNKR